MACLHQEIEAAWGSDHHMISYDSALRTNSTCLPIQSHVIFGPNFLGHIFRHSSQLHVPGNGVPCADQSRAPNGRLGKVEMLGAQMCSDWTVVVTPRKDLVGLGRYLDFLTGRVFSCKKHMSCLFSDAWGQENCICFLRTQETYRHLQPANARLNLA